LVFNYLCGLIFTAALEDFSSHYGLAVFIALSCLNAWFGYWFSFIEIL